MSLRWPLLVLGLLISVPAAAREALQIPQVPSQVQRLAGGCTNCHGPQGNSRDELVVSLAGRPAAELTDKLRAFRQPGAGSSVMVQIANAYSEEELKRLAEYFSQLPSQ